MLIKNFKNLEVLIIYKNQPSLASPKVSSAASS